MDIIALQFGVINWYVFICILVKWEVCHARPTSPKCIKELWEPIQEIDLSWKAIEERKEHFCEDHGAIFIKIVANKPGNSSIAPSSMNQ